MKSSQIFVPVLLAVVGGSGVLLSQVVLKDKDFKPPRTAVVDTFKVIEQYNKKEVLENELRVRVEEATRRIETLERDLKSIEAELKILEEGTAEHRKQYLRKTELGLKLGELNVEIKKDLESRQLSAIQEIRKEVELEIKNYSEAHNLGLVIEKTIPMVEGRGNMKIQIPLIRFVQPEIEITNEIASILNERYRKILGGSPTRNP